MTNFMFRLDKPLLPGLYKFNGQNPIGFEIAKPADCIKRVIFNDPATIVIWSDDSKTVVKCENEVYDPEKGLAMCIAKRAMGNSGNYYNIFKKFLPERAAENEDISSLIKKTVNKNAVDEYFPDFRGAAAKFAEILSTIGKKSDKEIPDEKE